MIRAIAILVLLVAALPARAQLEPALNIANPLPPGNPPAAAPAFTGAVAQYGFFRAFWDGIEVPLQAGSQQLVAALTGYVKGWMVQVVGGVLLMTMLYNAWTNDGSPFSEEFRLVISAYLIFTIASNADTYTYFVGGLFHGIVDGVGKAIAGIFGGTATVGADSFDAIGVKMFAVGAKVFSLLPWYSMEGVVLRAVVVIFWIVTYLLLGVLFIFYLVATVIFDFAIGLGPIFVAAAWFPLTRPFFFGWFKATAAVAIQQIVILAMMALFQSVLLQIMQAGVRAFTGGDGADSASQILMLVFGIVAVLILVYLTYKLLEIAMMIAGSGSNGIFPRWQGFAPSGGNRNAQPQGGGGHNGSAPSAPPASRGYAFQRTVGSAA